MNFDQRVEEEVIGILLKFPQVLKTSQLLEEDFYLATTRRAFASMVGGASLSVVASSLKDCHPEPEEFLMELVDSVVSPGALPAAVRHLKSLAATRKVSASISSAQALLATSGDPLEVAGRLTEDLRSVAMATMDLSHSGTESSFEEEVLDALLKKPWYEAGLGPKFMVRDSQLIAICARPGMGKSACGVQVAVELAARKRALVFSMEMERSEIWERIIAQRIGTFVTTKSFSERDVKRFYAESAEWMRNTRKMTVIDRSGLTADDICHQATAAHLAEPGGLSCVVVDYLSLIRYDRGLSRREGLEAAAPRFKILAKELKIPVFILQQLKREDKASSPRPDLMSIADTDQLGRDADQVWMIWSDQDIMHPDFTRTLPVTITKEKCRGGAVGDCHFLFEKHASRFIEDKQMGMV